MLLISRFINTSEIRKVSVRCLFLVIFSLIHIFPGNSLANQGNQYPATPEGVLEKFIQLDAKGKRLRGDIAAEILNLVSWTETGAEVVVLISHFKVGKATITGRTATVPVEYEEIGSTDTLGFTSSPRRRVITFKLSKDIVWKVDEPVTAPHVHWKVAITHLKQLQKMEPIRKDSLEEIIKKITEETAAKK